MVLMGRHLGLFNHQLLNKFAFVVYHNSNQVNTPGQPRCCQINFAANNTLARNISACYIG
jgi:hypothetical protein